MAVTQQAKLKSALKATEETGHELLKSFGKLPLSDDMVSAAEKFLVDCLSTYDEVDTLDELCFQTYHKKNFQLGFEKLPYTSKSISLHIRRVYLQCYRWTHVASMESIDLNPIEQGYSVDEDDRLVPEILDADTMPSDFPLPCNCLKCAGSNKLGAVNFANMVQVETARTP